MTFRSLALSNIRGNWRSYSAFFLSSVFSVMIFYIYAAFLYHPGVESGHIMAASKIRMGMVFCEYIIVIFSFLFVLYSNSAFLKTRQQEFGLFSLFGMTKTQLRKLVIYENAAIAIMAIVVGIGLGMLFSKLFFMALTVLLNVEESIPFAAPLKAIGLTAGGFFVLFMVISVGTALRIGRTEIVDLLKAARKPKGQLVFSRWLVAVAVFCLLAAYGMAFIMNSETFLVLTLPILITVIIGTYFLFTQLSILLLRFIQKRSALYYKRTNMIVFAQLGYKIRDNARILFIVSILSAVIMTALGTVYILQVGSKQNLLYGSPYTLAYSEKGLGTHDVIDPAELKRIVAEDGFTIAHESITAGVLIHNYAIQWGKEESWQSKSDALIISATDYNRLAAFNDQPSLHPENGKVTLVTQFIGKEKKSGVVSGTVNGKQTEIQVGGLLEANVMNWLDSNSYTLVMDDFSYMELRASVPEDQLFTMYGYELRNWEDSSETAAKLSKLVPEELQGQTDFRRSDRLKDINEMVSLTLFIGMFISLLFFIASGSMIYFKLFTELQDDQAQFRALTRIGMTRGEIRRIVVTQVGIVFFVPVVVGIAHALFAMKALDNMMQSSNWIYSFIVIGIYIAMQTIYFLVACSSYMKSMLRGASA
ncbi:putative ABC transport system permease protein [Paenibacillus endophyticus]|uniref:Putative ABC transport system permease protein n=1 Tax=Paenibacillus endophyticus TaxID=1294268 RepID=A0A7W5C3S5_9BACL|nr:ABC transporter permease [Paenibacillus endophyticus]MBB3150707.1 putative ABC transport system permease protein [Paenibacillus endophyticus]